MITIRTRTKQIFVYLRGYLLAIGLVALATWLKLLAEPKIIPADVPILYILAIVPTAIFFGFGPSILVCVLSVVAYDFFFISPSIFSIPEIRNVPILMIFLLVGLLFSYLASHLRKKNVEAVREIVARKQSQEELARYRDHLEDLVKQRTSELEKANAGLKEEAAERKQAETELFRVNRALRAITECNQSMVRATHEEALLKDVCRIMCDSAGYHMAWVGVVEHDDAKSIRPVAWGGAEDGYLANVAITWADTERGQGPTGLAVRTGETRFFQDFATEPAAAPWREAALARGYRSSIAIPLSDVAGNVFAVFALYASQPNAFTAAEVELLEELATDLAFGIGVLCDREKRRQAENLSKAMSAVSRIIHSTMDFDEIMQRTLSESAKAIGCDAAAISLREGGRWIVRYIHEFPESAVGMEMDDAEEPHAVLAIRTGKPVAVQDAFNDERVNQEHMKRWGIRSVLVVPVLAEDIAFGVLFFNFSRLFALSDAHVEFGVSLASSLSLALQNAHLFSNVQRELKERKKVEEEIEVQRRLLEAVVNNLRGGASIIRGSDFRVLLANPGYGNIVPGGKEIVGKTIQEVWPEVQPHFADVCRKVLATGEPYFVTDEPFGVQRFPDGPLETGYFSWSLFRVRLPGDEGWGLLNTIWDTTQRKRMEEEIRQTRDYLDNLFNYANAPIIVWDTQYRITRFNHAFERLTDRTSAEVMGKKLDILFPDDRKTECMSHISRASAGERWEVLEIPILHKDGSVRTLLWNSATVYGGDGKTAIATIAQGHDITERRQIEKAMQLERDKLISILNSMEDGVCIMNRDFVLEYVNPSLQSQYGDVDGRTCYQYFNGRDDVCPWCNNGEVFGGTTVRNETHSARTGRTYEITDAPLKNVDGSISKLAVFHDITDRKKVDELKDEFIGMVSHELKTPLTVILGALSTAADERVSEEEARELLGDAIVHTGILTSIVENLLELSRQQSGRLSLQTEPVDVGEVTRMVIDKLQSRSAIHHLVNDVPLALPAALADPFRVERIIYNLVDNAIKYSPDGGEVKISAHKGKNCVVVGVSDQGPGIARNDQARLFQSFERLGVTVKGSIQGTGLGLKVCRILVEAHGGRIWVKSYKDKGSTFFFTLPVRDDRW